MLARGFGLEVVFGDSLTMIDIMYNHLLIIFPIVSFFSSWKTYFHAYFSLLPHVFH